MSYYTTRARTLEQSLDNLSKVVPWKRILLLESHDTFLKVATSYIKLNVDPVHVYMYTAR